MEKTRLQRLRAGLDAIPQKRQAQELVGALQQYGARATTARTTLDGTAASERWSRTVFPGIPVAAAQASRRKAAVVAARLANVIRTSVARVRDDATSNQFAVLSEHATSAHRALRDAWVRQMEQRLKNYGALVRAAEAAGLPGRHVLATQLTLLQGNTRTPPGTEELAQRITNAFASLTSLVAQLGLEGPAGEFLVSAAAGKGDARALKDPEVRSFIERHGLWELFVVSFR
jgi:hypothetical protein